MQRCLTITVALMAIGSGAMAQAPVGAGPSFEAASVKPPDPQGIGAIDIRFFPNRFVATTVTLSQLIEYAYGIEAREIVGGPDWVRVERFVNLCLS